MFCGLVSYTAKHSRSGRRFALFWGHMSVLGRKLPTWGAMLVTGIKPEHCMFRKHSSPIPFALFTCFTRLLYMGQCWVTVEFFKLS